MRAGRFTRLQQIPKIAIEIFKHGVNALAACRENCFARCELRLVRLQAAASQAYPVDTPRFGDAVSGPIFIRKWRMSFRGGLLGRLWCPGWLLALEFVDVRQHFGDGRVAAVGYGVVEIDLFV